MISWVALLHEAVTKPGYIHEAYSPFHSYLLGSQLLALFQGFERGIQPGPLATFPKWKELSRHVKKGDKALMLYMSIPCKRTKTLTTEGRNRERRRVRLHAFRLTRMTQLALSFSAASGTKNAQTGN